MVGIVNQRDLLRGKFSSPRQIRVSRRATHLASSFSPYRNCVPVVTRHTWTLKSVETANNRNPCGCTNGVCSSSCSSRRVRSMRSSSSSGSSSHSSGSRSVDARISSSSSNNSPPYTKSSNNNSESSRRAALLQAAGLTLSLVVASPAAAAVSSVPAVALTGNLQKLSQALPFPLPGVADPEPVRFPRKPLDQRFAVLLMRSSYDAVNALDFIPMEAFEAKFWKLRQSELEGYNLLYAPLKMRQGDLTDPLYFDFISFSQYATISRAMATSPQHVFNEYVELCPPDIPEDEPCPGGTQLVQRPLEYDDDAQLPTYFSHEAGDLIYQGLRYGFRGKQFGGVPPAPAEAGIQQLAAGVQQLLGVMVDNGFALKAQVTDVQQSSSGSGGRFRVSVQGPCNLFSLHALGTRRALVMNAYDVLVIDAYLRASGKQGRVELELTDAGLDQEWVV